jgi:uncharacterized protein YuzE
LITIRRAITVEYDDVHDIAYLYLTPRNQRVGDTRNTVPVDLANGEDHVLARLVLDRDQLNRLLGIEVIGAMALLRPEFLLDDDDPHVDWTIPPRSVMKRVRSIAERAAIAEFGKRVQAIASETRRDVGSVLLEELALL